MSVEDIASVWDVETVRVEQILEEAPAEESVGPVGWAQIS